jgi:NAD(P)-dependent dehydrogenase (short-subunit alcohol dehydrogenase family)
MGEQCVVVGPEYWRADKGEKITMDLGLQGKRAIVTGGSRGIGKAIARELAREGVDVAIVARNKADLEATASQLDAETNRRILPLVADVTSREQVDRMVAQVAQQLGAVHILVNSGSAPGGSASAIGPIETVVDEDLLQDFNVKYVGALRCSRAVIPFMKKEGWGRIINISGANARNAGNLSGGARNTALVHMTKTLAVQLGRHGITVNCIHPGTTRTERTPSLLAARAKQLGVSPDEAERQDFAPDSPRGNAICRMVDASEIAFVTAFLASDKAWAVSGELVAATGQSTTDTPATAAAGSMSWRCHPIPCSRPCRHDGEATGDPHV